MKKLVIIFLAQVFLLACSANNKIVNTKLYQEQFPGFIFTNQSVMTRPVLSGYEYQVLEGEKLVVTTCEQASSTDVSTIADFDYFRFRLLLVSCKAIDKYSAANVVLESRFPAMLDNEFIYQLPAGITPLLSKSEFMQRQGLSIRSYDPSTQISVENKGVFKLLTKEDEVYITLLARGDFTNDGFEDLLIKSEWYARNAHGKHVDLLILSRPGDDKSVEISWRLNKVD